MKIVTNVDVRQEKPLFLVVEYIDTKLQLGNRMHVQGFVELGGITMKDANEASRTLDEWFKSLGAPWYPAAKWYVVPLEGIPMPIRARLSNSFILNAEPAPEYWTETELWMKAAALITGPM